MRHIKNYHMICLVLGQKIDSEMKCYEVSKECMKI